MDLIEWITLLGPKKVSEILGVSTETVQQWKRCDTSPKIMTAHDIVTKTHGALTWESIYAPYVAARLPENNPDQMKMNFKE